MAGVQVEGFEGLLRALRTAESQVERGLQDELRRLGEPVRADAETLAVDRIPRIGMPWSRMRVGFTTSSVYVAPVKRGSRIVTRKRRNLAPLLLDRALEPALQQNEARIYAGVDRFLADVERVWGTR